jgi:hypothetical protein
MNERASKRVKMSIESYKQAIVNELWSFGAGSVESNQADQVASVSCAKELLSKNEKRNVETLFGTVEVTFSRCPLVSGPIAFKFSKEFKAEFIPVVKRSLQKRNKVVKLSL